MFGEYQKFKTTHTSQFIQICASMSSGRNDSYQLITDIGFLSWFDILNIYRIYALYIRCNMATHSVLISYITI